MPLFASQSFGSTCPAVKLVLGKMNCPIQRHQKTQERNSNAPFSDASGHLKGAIGTFFIQDFFLMTIVFQHFC